MSKTRNLSDLLDANGDVKSTALDNVPASNDASALTTGTLDSARLGTITNFTSTGIDDNATSTAVTLDSSQNVLVGTTTTARTTDDGITLAPDSIAVSKTSDPALEVIRRSTNGDAIKISRDSNTAGTIRVLGSDILDFNGTSIVTNSIGSTVVTVLESTTLRQDVDNSIDLGKTTHRWKDLYLGGNIYLGGTGSANALDDYEEGTWTPTVIQTVSNPTISYNRQMGHYTKIGRLVIVTGNIYSTSVTNGSGNVRISNLPFIFNAQDNGMEGGISIGYVNGFTSTNSPQAGLPSRGNSFITLITNDGSDGRTNLDVAVTNTGTVIDINFSIVYITTS